MRRIGLSTFQTGKNNAASEEVKLLFVIPEPNTKICLGRYRMKYVSGAKNH